MAKSDLEAIRRDQLTEAAFRCIHKYGFAGTTVKRVAEEAKMSVGIVIHYFGSKDGLLEATMRNLMKKLQTNLRNGETVKEDPKSQIIAIINSNFAEDQVSPEAITVWLAFWGQALHVPALNRLQKINLARLRTNLTYWLKQLLPKKDAKMAGQGLAALIDGLWLRGAFDSKGIRRPQARAICLDYLDKVLSD